MTLVTNTFNQYKSIAGIDNPEEYNHFLRAHETAHYDQQINMGFANFYARTFYEYLKYGFRNVYDVPGTLEYNADKYANEFLNKK
jgi:hypothetical protein